MLDLAKEVGVELTAEDIKNYLSIQDNDSEKMTEEELEMVAGGKDQKLPSRPINCFVEDSKISTMTITPARLTAKARRLLPKTAKKLPL